jgi:hypothetical protein
MHAHRDELIIEKLREKHGISEDSARWLFARLQRSRAFDIIDESGMPVALYEDDGLSEIGDGLSEGVAVVSKVE